MFKNKEKEPTFYEREEARLQDQMFFADPYQKDGDYDAVLDKLERVHKLAQDEKKKEPKVNGDTLVKCGAYLIGIFAAIAVEMGGGLLRSGALKLLPKP